MNTEDAKYLVEKFLDGETSVKEELCLRDFFKSNRRRLPSMSQELRIAAMMMDELDTMCPAPVKAPRRWHPILSMVAVVAALVVVYVGVSRLIFNPEALVESQNGVIADDAPVPEFALKDADVSSPQPSADSVSALSPSQVTAEAVMTDSKDIAAIPHKKSEGGASVRLRRVSDSVIETDAIDESTVDVEPTSVPVSASSPIPMTRVSDPYFITVNQNVANLEAEYEEYETQNNVVYLSL